VQTTVTQTIQTVLVVLSVTMVLVQHHAVQNLGVEILISVADSVAPHSLLVILTVLAQLTITWQFLQDYLPVMAV
jgi:hypothetical protein